MNMLRGGGEQWGKERQRACFEKFLKKTLLMLLSHISLSAVDNNGATGAPPITCYIYL